MLDPLLSVFSLKDRHMLEGKHVYGPVRLAILFLFQQWVAGDLYFQIYQPHSLVLLVYLTLDNFNVFLVLHTMEGAHLIAGAACLPMVDFRPRTQPCTTPVCAYTSCLYCHGPPLLLWSGGDLSIACLLYTSPSPRDRG